AITGGLGTSTIATGIKQGATQALKQTTSQSIQKVASGGLVGGVSAGSTSATVQVVGSDNLSVDGTQVAIDTIKGVAG
ncbi:hypothetical protein, partial [Arsukibacterium sp.]|uniref:hypothetical protein n=1 Tax=Arsukibacterium sp. TaxID=1977258 RepID=UPI002FDB7175